MVDSVKNLLHSFDELSPDDQHVVVKELLERGRQRGILPVDEDYGELSDEAMVEIADLGFQRMDEEEAIGKTKTG